MGIVIRRLVAGEEKLANDFFNSVYKSSRSLENFRWEFVSGPEGPATYIIAIDDSASDTTKVVGIQCAIPLKLQASSGHTILTAKSEDTLVDPAYRGQKIFERMYEALFDECRNAGIRYIWGFTPAKKAFERIGFDIPFMAHQALMVFSPSKSYAYLSSLNPRNKTADKLKIAGLAVMSKLMSIVKSRTLSSMLNVSKGELTSMQAVMSRLLQGTPFYYLSMDEKYMQWRIADNPFSNHYEAYEFRHGDRLVAAAVINFRPERFGYVEQLVFASDVAENTKQEVMRHLVKIMKPRVDFIRALCFDTNAAMKEQQSLFYKSGFVVIKRGGFFVWKSLVDDALDPRQLFLTRLFTQGNQ